MRINEIVDNILENDKLKWDSLSEAEKNSVLEGLDQLEKGDYILSRRFDERNKRMEKKIKFTREASENIEKL